ncbi:MAG: tetratricopeptide repeat protein [Rhodospirillaceae bacterium]
MTSIRLIITFLACAVLSGCATQTFITNSQKRWHPREVYFQEINTDELESKANNGDSQAKFYLAIRLMSGDRIQRDEIRAVGIIKGDAIAGEAPAQYLLGAALAAGTGISVNETEAIDWFRKSAEQGYVSGEYWYGFMLTRGRGVEANWSEGLKWIRQAAEKGHEDAQFTIGEAFDSCRGGLPRDFEKAAMWYRRADLSGRGHMGARFNLRRLIDTGLTEWKEGDGGTPPIQLEKIPVSAVSGCD